MLGTLHELELKIEQGGTMKVKLVQLDKIEYIISIKYHQDS